jgi:hypothetical protein
MDYVIIFECFDVFYFLMSSIHSSVLRGLSITVSS